jgi:multidrug efflux pump subunit AcrB
VADLSFGRSDDSIRRIDRQRVASISADVNKETADIEAIKVDLLAYAQELVAPYPGLNAALSGEAEEQADSFGSLRVGLMFVLFVVYALLAIPFKSYGQPLIVMSVIPFGVIGALLGHMIMGMDLSLLSFMGMLALTGVVVNDSLVLVDYVNRRRADGAPLFEAISIAGVARFRAVMLTSLTTFAGLMPLIFEESTQAQFLIPMAVSLGFGILFATGITLILIPVNYMILEDIKRLFSRSPQTAEPKP